MRVASLILILLLMGVSCGPAGSRTEITETNAVPEPSAAALSAVPSAANEPPNLQWDAPSGWTPAPATSMRLANFRIGSEQETECYVAVLKGAAGGAALNMDRWRGQMGVNAEPLNEAGIAALPKIKMLGQDAPLLEVNGTYQSMEGQAHGGYTLLGTIVQNQGFSVFVKMIGPSASVQSQREAFIAFCGSLR